MSVIQKAWGLSYCCVLPYINRKESPPAHLEKKLGIGMEDFCNFIKLYLSMEEWFHSSSPKSEVGGSRLIISSVLPFLKKVHPRKHGQGHNIPKFHGMTKMQ